MTISYRYIGTYSNGSGNLSTWGGPVSSAAFTASGTSSGTFQASTFDMGSLFGTGYTDVLNNPSTYGSDELDLTALLGYPELAAELATEKERQSGSEIASTHVVVCEMTRRPWQEDTFRHEFRRIANAAGIPSDLQLRDLRATAATELANAGADVIDMSTHTTHRTVEMARRYARRSPEQFQCAAGKRLAVRNKTEPSDGTGDGTTEPKAVTP